jgi:ATP-dependent helicase HrpA
VLRAIDEAFGLADPAEFPRTRDAFAERLVAGRAALPPTLAELGQTAAELSVDFDAVRAALKRVAGKPGPWRAAHDDMQSQLAHLVPADLMLNAPPSRLRHLPRYLRAMKVRIERLEHDPNKDQTKAGPVVALWQKFVATRDGAATRGLQLDKLAELGWLLEELRVQTFAPELKTAVPVSLKRIQELWPSLAG